MKFRSFLVGCGTLALAVSIQAQTIFTWDGGGADNNLGTAFNWLDNVAPSTLNNANQSFVFAGTSRLTPLLGNNTYTINSLSFASGAGAFEISGPNNRQLRIGSGGIINNSILTQTINANINVLSAQTWNALAGDLAFLGGSHAITLGGTVTVDGAFNTTMATRLTGANGITKNGAGLLTISNSGNDYAGTTTVNSGTLRLGASQTLAGGLALAGGTFDLNNQTATYGNLSILGNSTLQLSNDGIGGTLNFGSVSWANGLLTIIGWDGFNNPNSDRIFIGGTIGQEVLDMIRFEINGDFFGAVLSGGELIAVPEPGPIGLAALGFLGLLFARRFRK